jgi:hypothetical protein
VEGSRGGVKAFDFVRGIDDAQRDPSQFLFEQDGRRGFVHRYTRVRERFKTRVGGGSGGLSRRGGADARMAARSAVTGELFTLYAQRHALALLMRIWLVKQAGSKRGQCGNAGVQLRWRTAQKHMIAGGKVYFPKQAKAKAGWAPSLFIYVTTCQLVAPSLGGPRFVLPGQCRAVCGLVAALHGHQASDGKVGRWNRSSRSAGRKGDPLRMVVAGHKGAHVCITLE